MLQRGRNTAILPVMQANAMARKARSSILFVLVVAFGGCSPGSNVQSMPIGSRCSSNGDCGTKPYNCITDGYPGGYCQKDCLTDGDCPADSECVRDECRRTCSSTAFCRAPEGYRCVLGVMKLVCDISPDEDGGSPNG